LSGSLVLSIKNINGGVLLLRMKWFIVLLATTVLLFSLSLTAVACPYPVLTGVTPAQGFDNEQVTITVSGSKFHTPKTTLKLVKAGEADIVATDVTVSKDSITGTVNLQGQAPGQWDIMVTNIGRIFKKKLKPTVLASAFTILPAGPQITSVTPVSAFTDTAITLSVSGTNFRPGATVSLMRDKQAIPSTNNEIIKNGEQINARINLKGILPGFYDVQVKNTDGSVAISKQAFTVVGAPVVVPEPTAQPVETAEPVKPVEPVKIDPNSLFKSIYFDFNKANIRNDQTQNLKANLKLVKQEKEGFIILGGHADERGPENYNIKLSAKRAETIKRYLISNGIPAKRIITYAYGETSPKYLGHNEESWQYNRRVDIAIWLQVPSRTDALKK
jgi:outer membrane protein OmpA-like peptidoglycan-associated protein